MSKKVTYRCDGPCEREGSQDDFGPYGHWLTLEFPEAVTPYVNTQYGLRQQRLTFHFCGVPCLTEWITRTP